ncbi:MULTISPECIES: 2OG-Fe dioxygenase family protein [Nocardia]|uniref:2OG-Fe dioxygenase family protein n=1 Tax=Nocardia TaxID=1817 RepID=UPI00351B4E3D
MPTAAGTEAQQSPQALGRDRPAVEAARHALVTDGVHLMPAALTTSALGLETADWDRFRRHWEDLSTDVYAGAHGTCRLRRYGQFSLTGSSERIGRLPQNTFVQPENSNPLYIGVDRTFEPLTESFVADPVFLAVLRLLARMATALDAPARWSAKVHPFRVIASADANGLPTPEGRHRDGVTLVSSLLVGRQNAAGGASSVFDSNGRRLLRSTLGRPGALLLGDDRRTLHSVSPVRPVDRNRPAYRDVLVVTFAPG